MSFWNIRETWRKINAVYNTISSGDLETLLRTKGNSSTGENVNADTAILQSTVFGCVRLLSDTTAQLPLKLFNTTIEDGRQSKTPATANPLYKVLGQAPNPSMTHYDYWKYNVSSMLLRGYYLSKIIYSSNGKVMELMPIPVQHVKEIRKRKDGRLEFVFDVALSIEGKIRDTAEQVLIGGGGRDATAHYCYYAVSSDGIKPLSPIGQNREAIGLAITAEKHGAHVFKNDATPPLIVQMPGHKAVEQMKLFAESWKKKGSGDNYGSPRFLPEGVKVENLTMSNEDAQYLETRQFQRAEIASAIFGVAPHMVGDTTQAKGWSTLEQQMNEFIGLTSQPYNIRIEEAIRRDLIPQKEWGNTFAKFITKGLLRGDIQTRMTFYDKMFNLGAMSPNEIRSLEDMNPREDEFGDQYYITANTRPETGEADNA